MWKDIQTSNDRNFSQRRSNGERLDFIYKYGTAQMQSSPVCWRPRRMAGREDMDFDEVAMAALKRQEQTCI